MSADIAPLNRWGQPMPTPAWYAARRQFPAKTAIAIADDNGALLEILLVDPKPDCSDMALDGQTYTIAEAESALKDFVLSDFHGQQKQPWAIAP